VRCPVWLNNPFGGFYFYAQHLVDVLTYIYGKYPNSVRARLTDKKLTVTFHYDHYDIVGLFTDENYSCYYAMRVSETHVKGAEFPIIATSPCFNIEFDEFYKLLCGEPQKVEYRDFIASVFVMNAIQASIDSGEEVQVKRYDV
jgi:hypothetical protein